MPAHYDDKSYVYSDYWLGRDYEHQSEVFAINRLLSGYKFSLGIDLGGGFGRLSHTFLNYCRKLVLVEPSFKLRSQAQKNLSSFVTSKKISFCAGKAEKIPLPANSYDFVAIIRVMHHLPDPKTALLQINRVLKPNGILLLEFANSTNFKSRIVSLFTGRPILPVPIDRRSPSNIKKHTIPFVNHHPSLIKKYLDQTGFEVISKLSVSNFRSPFAKKYLPLSLLLFFERNTQKLFSNIDYGPSLFWLCRKKLTN